MSSQHVIIGYETSTQHLFTHIAHKTIMVRINRDECEAYCVLLLLAWNDLVTNGGKMSSTEQEQSIKVRADDFIKILKSHYPHIPITPAAYEKLSETVKADKGTGMIRKAKEVICFFNAHWVDPSGQASGGQHADALLVALRGGFSHFKCTQSVEPIHPGRPIRA